MSLIAVPIAVTHPSEVEEGLRRAAQAVVRGARLVEWRVDGLLGAERGTESILRLVADGPAPCIVTVRRVEEGGGYDGDEASRQVLLAELGGLAHGPRYADVELESWRADAGWPASVERLRGRTGASDDRSIGLILSSHDFDGRPADLLRRVEAMSREPACDVVKVAWRARSLRDNLEAFDLLAARHKPTIALCMGEFGLASRVLAPKFGALLTFASDGPDGGTAPGQPTIDELRSIYRFDAIGAATRVYGVVGWPVGHSRSPHLHNAGFSAVGHDGVYLPLPVPPEYEHFKATVGALIDHPRLDLRGASVTIPHKAHLLKFVEERGGRVEELAGRVGAANTLIVGSAGGIGCLNTDAPAAVAALCAGMQVEPDALKEMKVAILGAGGMARAAAAGLAGAGANVIVFGRTQERVRSLAADLSGKGFTGKVVPGKRGRVDCGCFPVIVNCTPVGMEGGPDPNGSPLPDEMPLDERVTVFDTIYTPQRTPLVQEAEARGARVITGVDLFLRQAALQFEAWTGSPAPMETFRKALA